MRSSKRRSGNGFALASDTKHTPKFFQEDVIPDEIEQASALAGFEPVSAEPRGRCTLVVNHE